MERPVCPSVPGEICLHLTRVPAGRASGSPSQLGSELPGSAFCAGTVAGAGHTAESSQHGRCGRPAATGGPCVCSCLWPRAVKVAPGRKDEREGRSSVRGQKKCVFSSATFPRWVG